MTKKKQDSYWATAKSKVDIPLRDKKKKQRIISLTTKVSQIEVDKIDRFIEKHGFMNRSDFLRYVMREKLKKKELSK